MRLEIDEIPEFLVGDNVLEFGRPPGRSTLKWASLSQRAADAVVGEVDLREGDYDQICTLLFDNMTRVNADAGKLDLDHIKNDLPSLTVLGLFVQYFQSLQLSVKRKKP